MKGLLQKGAIFTASILLLSNSLWGKDKVEVITVHHFLSSKSALQTKFLIPWAKKIEKASKGRIKIDIFPSMTMGGKPNELYKQVRDGSADIVWTVAGYTPGVFPRTEVYELPTVHNGNALATSIAIRQNMNLIKDDFKDVKPLLIHVAAGNAIHTVNKKIEKVSDLKGLKLRTPSRSGGWLIEALGAEPVGMSLPTVAQSFAKNAIDGALLQMEIFPAFKFQDLTKYSTELKGGGGFGGSVLLILMNKDRYNSLPKDLQKVLDETTGIPLIKKFAKLADDFEIIGKKSQIKSGGEIITLNDKETKKFKDAAKRVEKRWVKDMNKKGIDGQKIIDTIKKSMAKY